MLWVTVPAAAELREGREKGERPLARHHTNLHTHERLKDKIRARMRACLMLNTGMHRCKVGCAFFTGQEWEYMCGYVQKDMGKPHYLFERYPPIEERTCHIYFFCLSPFTFSRLLVSFIRMFAHANALTHARTLARSVARSLGRSVARSLGRSAARGMLALYREAYKKKSDVMALNKSRSRKRSVNMKCSSFTRNIFIHFHRYRLCDTCLCGHFKVQCI